MEIKQNTSFKVPVKMKLSVDGSGETGLTYTSPTVYLQKQNTGSTVKTLVGASEWVEIDATNFSGVYDLLLSVSDTDTVGFLKYSVAVASCDTYHGLLEIVANIESDSIIAIANLPSTASLTVMSSSIIDAVYTRATGSLANLDVPVSSRASGSLSNLDSALTNTIEILSMLHKNAVIDSTVYDSYNNITSARVRCYDTKANALLSGSTGVIYSYTMLSQYDASRNLSLFRLTSGST